MANPFDPNNAANQAREAMRRQQENLRRTQESARQQRERQQQMDSMHRLQEFGREGSGRRSKGGTARRVLGMLMFLLLVGFLAFMALSGSHSALHHR